MKKNNAVPLMRESAFVFVPYSIGTNWAKANEPCVIGDDKIDYQVELFLTDDEPLNMSMAEWLQTNSHLINYGRSFPYIAEAHKVGDPDEYIAEDAQFFSLTYTELKEKVAEKDPRFDFDDHVNNYKKFLKLSIVGGAVNVDLMGTFVKDRNHYSVALFKAMLVKGFPSGEPTFDFCYGKGEFSNTIFIRLKGKKTYFYDFSHHPFK